MRVKRQGRWIGSAAAGLALLWAAPVSAADLVFCNQGESELRLAIGAQNAGQWDSHGWRRLRPGACTTHYAEADQTALFYLTSEPGFAGDGYGFCVGETEDFYIEGDSDCEARGYLTGNFRLIELSAGTSGMVFNLDGRGGLLAPPDLPVIDLTRPFQPPRPVDPPRPAGGERLVSGLAEGAHGPVFLLDGVFQGCEAIDGQAYCAFHAEGWKFFAYQGGPTPDAFLAQLDEIPMGSAITVAGDIVLEGDISAEVALREVTVRPEDPLAPWLAAMQGDWVSADDPAYRMTVYGSEAFEFYSGAQTGVRFLRVAATCEASAGLGPVLLTTELEGFETQCFLIQDGLPERLVLALAGQGGFVSFERAR